MRRIVTSLAILILAALASVALAKKGGGGSPQGPADPAITFGDGRILVANADGTEATAITGGSKDGQEKYPSWSPDANRIAFWRTDGDNSGIYRIAPDGTGEERIVALSQFANPIGVAWSPGTAADGEEKIAFCAYSAGNYELFVVNVDGTDLVNLTTSASWETRPSWSPGATAIAVRETPQGGTGSATWTVVVHRLGVVDGSLAITSSEDLTATGPIAGRSVLDPSWAKTQDLIVVGVQDATDREARDLWIIPVANPGNAYQVLWGDFGTSASTWSSDDSQILYSTWDPNQKPRGGGVLRVLTLSSGSSETIVEQGSSGSDWRR
ncbi:MAG: TolB family protein [Planctomycetota bacterium]|jgi:Tol biopolymer transport system component